VAGQSTDATRVYLVSEEACGPGGEAGKRNLYLWEAGEECGAGEMTFVAALAAADVNPTPVKGETTLITTEPRYRSTRVTPSGLQLAFMSKAPLTGYDSTDQKHGKAESRSAMSGFFHARRIESNAEVAHVENPACDHRPDGDCRR